MDTLPLHASLGMAASAPHQDAAIERAPSDNAATAPPFDNGGAVFMPPDASWLSVPPLEDEDLLGWPKWLHPVYPDNDTAVSMSATADETLHPSILPATVLPPVAHVLLPVAQTAEDADQFEMADPAVPTATAVTPSFGAGCKGVKRLRPKQLTQALRTWMERHRKPYATLEEKTAVAHALSISVPQVTNFCNNFRKRYFKVGNKLTSYRKLVSPR